MNDTEAAKWHLDKRVPVAIIAALLGQTGVWVWWASNSTARIEFLERAELARSTQSERIVRVETQVQQIGADVSDIKVLLRARPERLAQ